MSLFVKIELFDWTSPDEQTTIQFRVTEMLFAIGLGKLQAEHVTTVLDRKFCEEWLSKRELDVVYAQSLSPERLQVPVLGAWMPDQTVTLIDGGHRYLSLYLKQHIYIDYLLVALEDWQPYATIKGKWP